MKAAIKSLQDNMQKFRCLDIEISETLLNQTLQFREVASYEILSLLSLYLVC